jgi:hypothetical protein
MNTEETRGEKADELQIFTTDSHKNSNREHWRRDKERGRKKERKKAERLQLLTSYSQVTHQLLTIYSRQTPGMNNGV